MTRYRAASAAWARMSRRGRLGRRGAAGRRRTGPAEIKASSDGRGALTHRMVAAVQGYLQWISREPAGGVMNRLRCGRSSDSDGRSLHRWTGTTCRAASLDCSEWSGKRDTGRARMDRVEGGDSRRTGPSRTTMARAEPGLRTGPSCGRPGLAGPGRDSRRTMIQDARAEPDYDRADPDCAGLRSEPDRAEPDCDQRCTVGGSSWSRLSANRQR